jgi:hypothetical protein
MASIADLPELVGFFSYAREDDADSRGALSALRDRIQRELRAQLGRTLNTSLPSRKTLRLWQDREALAYGGDWERQINDAIQQSVFFIPIVTPTAAESPFCRSELQSFLAGETAMDRNDLVFPILYMNVRALDDSVRCQNDPFLSVVAKRQFLDWRDFRHLHLGSPDVGRAIERFCATITDVLECQWMTPAELARRGYQFDTGTGGLPEDDRKAARLYKLAADQGNALGQTGLGIMYEYGAGGLPRDEREAARLYKLAADQGDAGGQANLGLIYEYGLGGLPRDEKEAARLYKLAAEQGNIGAQVNLGVMYELGRGGLPKDKKEAVRLYRLAAGRGDGSAKQALARLGVGSA